MEIGEAVAVAVDAMQKAQDPSCDKEDKDKGWQSRVNKHNSQETCTGQRLYTNMWNNRAEHAEKGMVVPEKVAGAKWKLDQVTETNFPVQAHHLIPKNFLPDHKVCTWLAIKYKHDTYKLRYDSNYDADDARNGYCMPYATPLAEWKGNQAAKTIVAMKVMEKTGIQLHQGSHAKVLDASTLEAMAGRAIVPEIDEPPLDPASDEYTQAGIHQPGYLNRVELLLEVVNAKAFAHAEKCAACKKKKQGKKTLVLPSAGVTELMHRVSAIIKVLIDMNVMHVSGYAYYYAYHGKKIEVRDGEIFLRGLTRTKLQKLV